MSPDLLLVLTAGVFVIALLYSSVGHAGASGYIAVMSLLGLAPEVIKPTALTLNILVASIGAFQFWRAGHFSWRLFWPFALLSAPFAFLGGYLDLPTHYFKLLVGIVLLFSAVMLLTPYADVGHPLVSTAALALGAGFSSNIVNFGSLAGIIVVESAARNGVKISFMEFFRAGVIASVIALLLAAAWIAVLQGIVAGA
jgi:uncharacterized membrane protein YfcA